MVAVATVEEEFGAICLGARTATESIDPQLGIAIDVFHGDMPGAPLGEAWPLGGGPALGVGANIHPKVLEGLRRSARGLAMPFQVEGCPIDILHRRDGHPDRARGRPHGRGRGPCRYMHTGIETVDPRDVDRCAHLLTHYLCERSPWSGARRRCSSDAERGPGLRGALPRAVLGGARRERRGGARSARRSSRALRIPSIRSRSTRWEAWWRASIRTRLARDPVRAAEASRARTLMLCAHMDEIGAMVFAIEKDGRLRFRKVGGIDNRILGRPGAARRPRGNLGRGGSPPPHLVSRADREKVTPVEDLYIDIGADSREEAAARVSVGDYATFDTRYERWGQTRKGKAFDDRVGCAVLASVVQRRPPIPVTAVWSVQEEVGLRGAAAAARRVAPDLAIVLEGTAAGDAPGLSAEEAAPWMGHGPALTVQDRSLMADARLVDRIERTAKRRKIPTQWKRPGVGGTDAGRIALSGTGVPSAVISVPCRYIHAPAAYLDIRDARRTVELVWHTMITLTKEWP